MRLDHLLSKEHTPRQPASVRLRMVVFTSGIVDEGCAWCLSFALVLPRALVWGVERGGDGCGGWLCDTLLSFEGSAFGWCSQLPPLGVIRSLGWFWLVGGLFVNWIVDASILHAHVLCVHIAIKSL